MPEPDPELRRHQQPVRLLLRPTRTATSARTTTWSGSTSTTRFTARRVTAGRPARPGNTLFTGMPFCGPRNNGDPIVLYDQFAGRWMVSQFAFNSTSQGPFYQCIAVSDTDDPTGLVVRVRVPRPPHQVQRLPEVRDLARAEHVHDDGAAVQLERRPGRLGLRARPDARLRDGPLRLPGHGHPRCRRFRGCCRRTRTARPRRRTVRQSRSSPTTTTAPGSRQIGSMSGTRP